MLLDIFNNDAFSVTSLTDAINNEPFVPGLLGQLIDWNEQGVMTTSITIESINGVLTIVNPTPRGGPGETVAKDKRTARQLRVPHYQIDDAVYADEVQNVRAFGQEMQLQSLSDYVNQRLGDHVKLRLDPTVEFQRLGAVKGVILNGDGSTLYNLFTEFGVSQAATIDFNLDAASPASGVLRGALSDLVNAIADALGNRTFTGVGSIVGANFFKSLMAHKEVVQSYTSTPMAAVLRTPYVDPSGNKYYGTFEFGGVQFFQYRGKNGATPFVGTDEARFFPIGVPGLFKTVNAPADYIDTVNISPLGVPRYARQWPMHNNKGIHLEAQANSLSYCTIPQALFQGTTT